MAAETNVIITTDILPAITIDIESRLVSNIDRLREIMGITEMRPVTSGSTINLYKTVVGTIPAQVPEGDIIPLTPVDRVPAGDFKITLDKFRKSTTAEAILQSGLDAAVNDTDRGMINKIRQNIKNTFYGTITQGTGTTTGGATLQQTLANLWADLHVNYEDQDVSTIFFINPMDVAEYLGGAAITTQTAFGFDYVENFLGLGTAIFTAQVTKGEVWGTVKENLRGVYVPVGGEVNNVFGMTADESGLITMKHTTQDDRATVDTLLFSAFLFFAEDLAGIFKATITPGV